MQYWKRIDIDNWEVIAKKSLDYLYNHTNHLDKTKFIGPFNSLYPFHFIEHVPEILPAFRKHGLHFEAANIFVMWDNRDAAPHKDYADSIARINIPLLNCEGTYTTFYDKLVSKRLILPTGAPFYMTVNKDYTEVDRVELTQPTIYRICEGHSVQMDDTRSPRVSLSLAFSPDPGFLLDDFLHT